MSNSIENYILGLEWSPLPGSRTKDEIKNLVKMKGSNYGVIRKIKDGEVIRHQVGITESINDIGKLSLASVVADKYENAIVVIRLSEGEYWLCCVSDREIVIGYDQTISDADIARQYEDARDTLEESGVEFNIYAEESIALGLDIENYEPIVFDDIVKNIKKDRHEIKKLVDNKILKLTVSVIAIGIAAHLGYGKLTEEKITSEDLAAPIIDTSLIEEQRQKKVLLEQQKKQDARIEALNDEDIWLMEYLTKYDAVDIALNIKKFLQNTNKSYEGWERQTVQWQSATPKKLLSTWSATDNGDVSPLVLMNSDDGYDEIKIDPNGEKAATSYKIGRGRTLLSDTPNNLVQDKNNSYEHILDEFVKKGFEFKLAEQAPLRRKRPIKIVTDENDRWNWIKPLTSYATQVSGRGAAELLDFALILQRHQNITIKTMSYDTKVDSWNFTGIIYER